jgi:integrase
MSIKVKIKERIGKKGTTFQISTMRDGKRFSKSFKTKYEALTVAKSIELRGFQALINKDTCIHSMTLEKAVGLYIASKTLHENVRLNLRYWVGELGQLTITDVQKADIKNALKKLNKRVSNSTCNRYKSSLSSVFRYIEDEYDIKHNPCLEVKTMKEPKGKERFLSDDEIKRLLKAAKTSNWSCLYAFIYLALTTGARRSEILGIKWRAIDFKDSSIYIETTKNGDSKKIHFPDNVKTALLELRSATSDNKHNKDDYVFYHPNVTGKTIPFRNFDSRFKKVLKVANIKNFRVHDLRHSCASLLAKNQASIPEIMQVLGHKTPAMTMRYAHLCTSHQKQLINKVMGDIE